MGWLGKIIGGTIGFAMGGPLGAVAGAVFGHAFDANEAFINEEFVKYEGHTTLSHGEESQMAFFVSVFSMLAKLAQADGRINKEELDTIEKFMNQDLKLSPDSHQVAANILQAALNSPTFFEHFANQFYKYFKSDQKMLDLILDVLFRVAQADGVLVPAEEAMILSAKRIFNFSTERYNKIKSRYIDEFDRYYNVLKCDPAASDSEVKRQYRRIVQEYHPDKVAAKGLPKEFIKFAGDKFREVQEAYEKIKQQRGMK